jgi:hypothetical protein
VIVHVIKGVLSDFGSARAKGTYTGASALQP